MEKEKKWEGEKRGKGEGKREKGNGKMERKKVKIHITLLVFQDLRYPVHWIDKYFLSEFRNFFFFSPRKIGNRKIAMKNIQVKPNFTEDQQHNSRI